MTHLIFGKLLSKNRNFMKKIFFVSESRVFQNPHPEIKNWEYFRHFDTLTTFWGAFKKMYGPCEVGVEMRKNAPTYTVQP